MTVPLAAAELATPEEIARASGSSFLVSFAFLGRTRRRGLTAVYAFCRVADDAVDDAESPAAGRERLGFWGEELRRAYGEGGAPTTAVGGALRDAAANFGVPRRALEDVLDGMAMDLAGTDYATPEDLERYCYRVAAAVGLACLPVFGARGVQAEQYAEHLGRALQWTNILRDIHGDALAGRVYVPQSWMAEEGLTVGDLMGQGAPEVYAPGGAAARLVARFVARARGHFNRAAACRPPEFRRQLLPARIMGAVYFDLLDRLEARGGAWVGPRLRLGRRRKLWLAARTWLGRR